ncbi:hypothetical protein PG994_005967 [Apiospora phragmitis]|uniref:Aminotransferase class I/classII large domain-containing protein n=1 Tax=Apiospora phragmitis TaxID=2905665 RepID=A0ABR1VGA7_9PEZI
MDFSNVSTQMGQKLQAILPSVAASHGPSTGDIPSLDLSIAENGLLTEQFLALAKGAIHDSLAPKDLAYPAGFGGDPKLLQVLASFFNRYFHPAKAILPDQIITASGAGNALDALLCSICEPGDRAIVLEGFSPYFLIHANVSPIIATVSNLETATQAGVVIEALRHAYDAAANRQKDIKAVVVTNPNNPLGQCYSREVLRDCLEFCHAHNLHFISDEVYALSTITGSAVRAPKPFVSVLALLDEDGMGDAAAVAAMAPKVHMVWSMSKDFGCSGIRMANPVLRLGSGLASYWQTSSLTSVVARSILGAPQLPDLLRQNSEALGAAYCQMTDGLAKMGNVDEEKAMLHKLAQAGLIFAHGQKFSVGESECGWARITFSISAEKIGKALAIMERFLQDNRSNVTDYHAFLPDYIRTFSTNPRILSTVASVASNHGMWLVGNSSVTWMPAAPKNFFWAGK